MGKKKNGGLEPIGKKIRTVRAEKDISLEVIANETGLSLDYLVRVESGKQIPSVGNLLQISRALGIDSGYFLKMQEENLEDRAEAYTKRTDNYAYTPLSHGAENKRLKPFRIFIEPMETHDGVGYQHEGEEFVYVLSGSVEVTVGDHVNRLKKDEALHFNSGIKHHLRNTGNEKAELLVIVATK